MAVTKDDLVKAIQNLNELTRDQKVRWEICDSPAVSATVGFISVRFEQQSYCTPYHGKILRITERYSAVGGVRSHRQYLLEIIDDSKKPIYTFPDIQGIADLYQSIEFRSSGVEDIIKSLADPDL